MTVRSLLFACGLLSCIIAAESYLGLGQDTDDSQTPTLLGPARSTSQQQSAMTPSAANQWVSVVLGRPLFAPDRRPVAGASDVDPGLPRLSGVIVTAVGAVAIFQPTGDGKTIAEHAGDLVSGWEVTDISVERVGVRKANDVAVLRPRFANLQGNATSSGAAKPPR